MKNAAAMLWYLAEGGEDTAYVRALSRPVLYALSQEKEKASRPACLVVRILLSYGSQIPEKLKTELWQALLDFSFQYNDMPQSEQLLLASSELLLAQEQPMALFGDGGLAQDHYEHAMKTLADGAFNIERHGPKQWGCAGAYLDILASASNLIQFSAEESIKRHMTFLVDIVLLEIMAGSSYKGGVISDVARSAATLTEKMKLDGNPYKPVFHALSGNPYKSMGTEACFTMMHAKRLYSLPAVYRNIFIQKAERSFATNHCQSFFAEGYSMSTATGYRPSAMYPDENLLVVNLSPEFGIFVASNNERRGNERWSLSSGVRYANQYGPVSLCVFDYGKEKRRRGYSSRLFFPTQHMEQMDLSALDKGLLLARAEGVNICIRTNPGVDFARVRESLSREDASFPKGLFGKAYELENNARDRHYYITELSMDESFAAFCVRMKLCSLRFADALYYANGIHEFYLYSDGALAVDGASLPKTSHYTANFIKKADDFSLCVECDGAGLKLEYDKLSRREYKL